MQLLVELNAQPNVWHSAAVQLRFVYFIITEEMADMMILISHGKNSFFFSTFIKLFLHSTHSFYQQKLNLKTGISKLEPRPKPFVCVNKVLLEHHCTDLFTYHGGLPQGTLVESYSCNRNNLAQNQKSLPIPGLEFCHFRRHIVFHVNC